MKNIAIYEDAWASRKFLSDTLSKATQQKTTNLPKRANSCSTDALRHEFVALIGLAHASNRHTHRVVPACYEQ